MSQANILKGLQISRDIPYRDPEAIIALAGTDGMGKNTYLPVGNGMIERHILLLGSAATGKTNMLLHLARNLRANLSAADAMVIFDPTGEYRQTLYQKGDVVLCDDDDDAIGDGSAWNLFSELLDDDRLLQDASELCDLLFQERINEVVKPYYPTAARDLTMALIVFLKKNGDLSLCNNKSLRELIDGFDVDNMREILQSEPELRSFSCYVDEAGSERAQGVIASLQRAARVLLAGRFGQQGTLGIRPLLRARGGKVIFICYNPARGSLTRPVFAALCDLCLKEALCQRTKKGNLYMFLDNISVLSALPHLEDALLLGRGKGLKIMLSAVAMSALAVRYGAVTQTLLSAIGTTVAFRLRDKPSREYIKSLYGHHRVVESYRSSVQRGMAEQVMDEYVIGDEVLTELQVGESIIATMHYPPFLFRLRPYGAN